MFKDYFGLTETPFSIAPDPHYLYMSEFHREALAHLLYGIESDGGFVLLTGEVGTGKTTVCRCLIEQLPDTIDAALILNPKLNSQELLATLCDELGISYSEGAIGIKIFVDMINAHLLDSYAKGRKTVLIIDEAQNLSSDVLEQIRLLTNLETNERKLLQIIMLGQPELREKLEQPELKQLAQRITARYHLGPLSRNDIPAYIARRLRVAGTQSTLFSASAIKALYGFSGGIPRLINIVCDRALLGAFAEGRKGVDSTVLIRAAREVFGKGEKHVRQQKMVQRFVIAFLLSGTIFAFVGVNTLKPKIHITPVPVVWNHAANAWWLSGNTPFRRQALLINGGLDAGFSGNEKTGICKNSSSTKKEHPKQRRKKKVGKKHTALNRKIVPSKGNKFKPADRESEAGGDKGSKADDQPKSDNQPNPADNQNLNNQPDPENRQK
ncbi:MAG TPA: AAA family ATPase [Dissulfurispiraceae bacterium]|nr:AAA family ATPase [Dissulfurispiraceae bacterium]